MGMTHSKRVEWALEELQLHLDEVIFSERLVFIEDDNITLPMVVSFRYPKKKERTIADVVYKKTFHRAVKDGMQTEEEMMKILEGRGIWSEKDQKKADALRGQIDLRKKKLADPDIDPDRKPYLEEAIEKIEEELWKVELRKENALMNSAERQSRQTKFDYLIWACSRDPETGETLNQNYLTFLQSLEEGVRRKLLKEFVDFLDGHTVTEIRYMARSNLWRISYTSAAKASMPLFPGPISELTPDQLNLIWWSGYYQSIYEMLPEDQPEDWVIEDDDLLDKHMEGLHKERTKEHQAKRSERKLGNRTAMKMPESLVFRSHPDYDRLKYDKVNETQSPIKKDTASRDLRDERLVSGQRTGEGRKMSKGIAKSRRYSPPKDK